MFLSIDIRISTSIGIGKAQKYWFTHGISRSLPNTCLSMFFKYPQSTYARRHQNWLLTWPLPMKRYCFPQCIRVFPMRGSRKAWTRIIYVYPKKMKKIMHVYVHVRTFGARLITLTSTTLIRAHQHCPNNIQISLTLGSFEYFIIHTQLLVDY